MIILATVVKNTSRRPDMITIKVGATIARATIPAFLKPSDYEIGEEVRVAAARPSLTPSIYFVKG
jgi:hypothetical protein